MMVNISIMMMLMMLPLQMYVCPEMIDIVISKGHQEGIQYQDRLKYFVYDHSTHHHPLYVLFDFGNDENMDY